MRQNRAGGQNLYNLLGRFSLLFFVSFSILYGEQSFKDFKKTQTDSFQNYKDERDKAFERYLKEEWHSYKALEPLKLYEEPKPDEIEPSEAKREEGVGPKVFVKIKEDDTKDQNASQEEPKKEDDVVITVVQKREVSEKKEHSFDFFGTPVTFNTPQSIKNANFYPTNQNGIANFFRVAASSEYDTLLGYINKLSKELNLNDWGVYLLVTKISDKIFNDEDVSKLYSWFLFNKLGYAVKVGIANRHVVLMHYSKKPIYATPNYDFGGKKYYLLSHYAKERGERVFSYSQDYENATKEIDLSLQSIPNFVQKRESKTVSFSKFGSRYSIPFSYNKNLIDFMASYPQADYETFFNAPMDEVTYKETAIAIKGYIDGKKASEAIDFVLSFVQKSFKYEQDNRQFKREKVMFAQETLFFDRSDCEDRAILFSYLIKKLFDIDVVGVKYKDHMSTALYIPLEGDSLKVQNRRFVIADPTYIDAPVGKSMPKYKSVIPQSFIVVK